jgi:predicted NUDIX family phosphoesterase
MKQRCLSIHRSHLLQVAQQLGIPLLEGRALVPLTKDQQTSLLDRLSVDSNLLWWTPREVVDNPVAVPEFAQFLMYTVLRDPKTHSVFVYNRSKKEGETRLLGKTSIGVGGHPELCDLRVSPSGDFVNEMHTIIRSMTRELYEECGVHVAYDLRDAVVPCGETELSTANTGGKEYKEYDSNITLISALIYGAPNNVDHHHLGMLCIIDVPGLREVVERMRPSTEIMEPRVMSIHDLVRDSKCESWTRLAGEYLLSLADAV